MKKFSKKEKIRVLIKFAKLAYELGKNDVSEKEFKLWLLMINKQLKED